MFKKNIKIQDSSESRKNDRRAWRKDSREIVLGVFGWSLLGRSDVLLLAFLVSPSEVGTYFLCIRLAEILIFFSSVSFYIWGGEISNQIQKNNLKEVQNVLRKASRLCISTTFIIASLAWYFAEELLKFINESYVGDVHLFKLALLVFFFKGSAGILPDIFYLLAQQKFLAKLQWALGLSFFALILITVPSYGLEGCLVSFAFCQIVYIVILNVRLITKHKLSFLPI
jgi:O-antigen/teichoic acid export membrane protein